MIRRTVVLAGLLLASTFAIAPVAAAEDSPGRFRVLSHNVMMLTPLAGDYANGHRAGLIADAGYVKGYDVMAFSEAFDEGPSNTLKAELTAEYPHQTPVLGRSTAGWDQSVGPLLWPLTPEDGGVTILSKWPITKKIQHIYDPGCGFDALANKGFVYVELDVHGRKVHVVATHAQADDSLCLTSPAAIRSSQFGAIDQFLDRLNVPSSEPVIVTGDLNVARSTPEFDSMLATLDTVPPASYDGSSKSFDPTTNSLAAQRYPGEAPVDLDYVLLRRTNQAPGSWTNTVLTPKSPPWTAGGVTYDDYSDHYPVSGG